MYVSIISTSQIIIDFSKNFTHILWEYIFGIKSFPNRLIMHTNFIHPRINTRNNFHNKISFYAETKTLISIVSCFFVSKENLKCFAKNIFFDYCYYTFFFLHFYLNSTIWFQFNKRDIGITSWQSAFNENLQLVYV